MTGLSIALRSADRSDRSFRPRHRRGRRHDRDAHSLFISWGGAVAVTAAAWVIRAVGITVNYDIFVDETTYTRIADNLATGHGLTLYGVPFDLHPPAAFAIMAAAIKIFSLHGSLATVLFSLRPFVALLGALTCALVFVLIGGLTSWPVGLAAAAVIALDPFEIYYDSRVMLEAPAQLAAAGSVILLVASIGRSSGRWSWLLTGCGGLAAGFTLCVKENFGLVLAVMLVFAIVLGWALERIKAAFALGLMLSICLLSQLLVMLTGGLGPWRSQVGSGLMRLVGAEQTSGFNSATVHVSLLSRIAANGTHFGLTYLILGFGGVAGGWLVINAIRHRVQWRRDASPAARRQLLVGLWAVAAGGYLAYATAFGTLEEQMYYVLLVPALCTLVIWCRQTRPSSWRHWRKVLAAVFVLTLIADGAVWTAVHRTRDDEYRQLLSWIPEHLPYSATVSVTEDTAQFLLQGVIIEQADTVAELADHRVDYVLLSSTLANQGYGIASVRFEHYLETHAKVAWEATGPSSGALILFDVRAISGAR